MVAQDRPFRALNGKHSRGTFSSMGDVVCCHSTLVHPQYYSITSTLMGVSCGPPGSFRQLLGCAHLRQPAAQSPRSVNGPWSKSRGNFRHIQAITRKTMQNSTFQASMQTWNCAQTCPASVGRFGQPAKAPVLSTKQPCLFSATELCLPTTASNPAPFRDPPFRLLLSISQLLIGAW